MHAVVDSPETQRNSCSEHRSVAQKASSPLCALCGCFVRSLHAVREFSVPFCNTGTREHGNDGLSRPRGTDPNGWCQLEATCNLVSLRQQRWYHCSCSWSGLLCCCGIYAPFHGIFYSDKRSYHDDPPVSFLCSCKRWLPGRSGDLDQAPHGAFGRIINSQLVF